MFITYNKLFLKMKFNQRASEYKSIQRTYASKCFSVHLITLKTITILAQACVYFSHKNFASLPNFHRFVTEFYT